MKKLLIFSLVLMICLSSFVTTSFASEYPSIDDVLAEYEQYHTAYYVYQEPSGIYVMYLYFDNNNYHEEMGAEFSFKEVEYNNIQAKFYDSTGSDRHFSYKMYVYREAEGLWKTNAQGNDTLQSTGGKITYTLLDSTHDIYDSNGELFFQVPSAGLAEAIMKVVKAEIPATQTTLAQTMRTIVLCGVGCLALLISLALLVKALRRCLPR